MVLDDRLGRNANEGSGHKQTTFSKINLDTSLKEFGDIVTDLYWSPNSKIRNKGMAYVISLIESLSKGRIRYTHTETPRQVETIQNLYSLTRNEIYSSFPGYGEKTWKALNSLLSQFNLPELDLPYQFHKQPKNYSSIDEILSQTEKSSSSINHNTDLEVFGNVIRKEIRPLAWGPEKGKVRRTVLMLRHLYNDPSEFNIRHPIKTVDGLYSLEECEIFNMRFYGKSSFLTLNSILNYYDMPQLKLPKEYTFDLQPEGKSGKS